MTARQGAERSPVRLPIGGAVARDDLIRRFGGHGDNWYSTLGPDGTCFVAMCDGSGFDGHDRSRYFNTRMYTVTGTPETGLRFHPLPGYPDLSVPIADSFTEADLGTRYYGFGMIAVDGVLTQFLSTWNRPPTPEILAGRGALRFVGAKLIYSPDGGVTWHNQDGSTPVRWEDWGERSNANMAFYEEDGETFSLPSILQMGPDYSLNTDGHVYVYSPDGNVEGTMNRLVMFRVPQHRLRDRSAYEYFVRRHEDGTAVWSRDISARGAVHTFPAGWVNAGEHPYAWQPSVVFHPGLGVYLMANWATGPGVDGTWFGRHSYLGLYQSRQPWGPWEQFYEDTAWAPAGDPDARCYQPVIMPNWSSDRESIWLTWTDYRCRDWAGLRAAKAALRDGLPLETYLARVADLMPYYGVNTQRFDLVIAE